MKKSVRIILSDTWAALVIAVAAVFACYLVVTLGTEAVHYLQGVF